MTRSGLGLCGWRRGNIQAWGVAGGQPNGWEMEGTWRHEGAVEGWEKQDGPPSTRKLLTETFNGCLDLGNHRGFWEPAAVPAALAKPRGKPKLSQRNFSLAPRTQILGGLDVSSGALPLSPFLYSQSLWELKLAATLLPLSFPVPLDL